MSTTPLTDAKMTLVEGDTALTPGEPPAWAAEIMSRYERYDLTVDFSDGATLYMTFASPVDGTLFRVTCPDDEEAGMLFMIMEGFSQWLGREIRGFAGGYVTAPGTYTVTLWA